ncbi:hypothetical protein M3193_08060 [Sporosarcina luteola]|uniref:hypothetical protein n=1 Tax=Sporosarcina luteola TaxID=582850 RepID=UPI00203BBBBE|nr:hypothetical protein [Sporosarcina luteola]MCM3744095.1 hypothetical protein [Sporosarcina luteola]
MKAAWIIFLIELLVYHFLKHSIEDQELAAIILIFINIPFVLIAFSRFRVKIISLFLLLGFSIRMVCMFFDIYGRGIFMLPHSGGDTEGFLMSGLRIANDLSLLFETIYGGVYSKFLGIVFFIGPEDRLIGQYINVLLGITIILIVLKIFSEMDIEGKTKNFSLIIMLFLPHAIIFSSILLRENIIAFLVTISLLFFIKWYKNSRAIYLVLSTILVLLASLIHSGVIGIVLGYFFMLIFYSRRHKKLVFSSKSFVGFILLVLLMSFISLAPIENVVFLSKFTQYAEDVDDVYNIATGSGRGGSSYLTGITIDSPVDFLIYGPIKMIYFIGSPLPWDWRGILDITSFAYDGLVYLLMFLYPIINYKKIVKKDPLTLSILVMIVSTIFIFGIGVSNAGTALRHRYKMFYILLILATVTLYRNKSLFNKNKN